MTLKEAFDVVLDLAIDNAIEAKDADYGEEGNALASEYKRQQEAIQIVCDFELQRREATNVDSK